MHASHITVAAFAIIAAPAAAQDYPASPPPAPMLPYAPVYDDAPADVFAGPRIEIHGGWDHVGVRLKNSYTEAGQVSTASVKGRDDGITYGGSLGWDIALTPTLIAGVEAGIEDSSIRECSEVFGLDEACIKAGRTVEVGGRLGQALSSRVMVYARAAYVNSRVKANYVDFEGILDNESAKANVDGVRLGAGFEAAVTPNLYLKGEYRYTDYNNYSLTTNYSDGSSDRTTLSLDRHQILGGIGLRF
ncbi:outer membrane protein [Sphingomonas arantia]|uniref:Outer membrane protein n=1 Tax=Sphingomonas arantia TaxID=1460676 RepID=A0ABW4TS34_9SPHN